MPGAGGGGGMMTVNYCKMIILYTKWYGIT